MHIAIVAIFSVLFVLPFAAKADDLESKGGSSPLSDFARDVRVRISDDGKIEYLIPQKLPGGTNSIQFMISGTDFAPEVKPVGVPEISKYGPGLRIDKVVWLANADGEPFAMYDADVFNRKPELTKAAQESGWKILDFKELVSKAEWKSYADVEQLKGTKLAADSSSTYGKHFPKAVWVKNEDGLPVGVNWAGAYHASSKFASAIGSVGWEATKVAELSVSEEAIRKVVPSAEFLKTFGGEMLKSAKQLACSQLVIPNQISVSASLSAGVGFVVEGQGAVEFSATWDTADICKP